MQWQDPFVTEECKGNEVDYIIKVRGRLKLFHINMLKKFYERDATDKPASVVQSVIVDNSDPVGTTDLVFFDPPHGSKSFHICEDLSEQEIREISTLINKYPDVFSDKPGKTDTTEHVIRLTTDIPVHKKPYPMPQSLIKAFNDEVDKMIELRVIEPSDPPYCSPVIMVRKADQTWRLCIDFRCLNNITIFDAEPMPTGEESLGNFVGDCFFSEIDMVKGYFQILLNESCKIYTAFATHRGLMQFTRLPFGLKTVYATFIRHEERYSRSKKY